MTLLLIIQEDEDVTLLHNGSKVMWSKTRLLFLSFLCESSDDDQSSRSQSSRFWLINYSDEDIVIHLSARTMVVLFHQERVNIPGGLFEQKVFIVDSLTLNHCVWSVRIINCLLLFWLVLFRIHLLSFIICSILFRLFLWSVY